MKARVTAKVQIDVTPGRVFELLSNASMHRSWSIGLASISVTGYLKEGLEYESVNHAAGRKIQTRNIVTQLVPEKVLALESMGGPISYKMSYLLTEMDGGTELKADCSITAKNSMFDIGAPLIESLARSRMETDLTNIKNFAEAMPRSTTHLV